MRLDTKRMTTLTIGFSPCPNDTFIFHALVQGIINAGDLAFTPLIDDVESLNRMAMREALDVTKVSSHAFAHLHDRYCLLRSGGALGRGCGPIVVARDDCTMRELRGRRIAIPGTLTTAYLLLQIFDPVLAENIAPMPFHLIMESVKNGEADAGLLIHEGRFTYEQYGLRLLEDLGSWWEQTTGALIPLGCIVARRSLGRDLLHTIDGLIGQSVLRGFSDPAASRVYVKTHAQEMDDEVIRQHIGLYVNDYSVDISDEGLRAVETLFRMAAERGLIPKPDRPLLCTA